MSLPDPNPVWLQRWTSLAKSITDTRENCKTEEPFAQLLADLQKFGKKQFYYFYLGFSHDTQPDATLLAAAGCDKTTHPQPLEKDHDYPPDYVLRTIIDQVSYDYEVIQRALHQRLNGTPAQKEALVKADRWGHSLLQPLAMANKGEQDAEGTNLELLDFRPAVITYFNRSPMIRMIPYANVALLGVPMTVMGAPLDFLVLAHELGHYVYWHGRIGDESIHSKLQDIVQGEMPYIKNWIEEIFADVLGFVVSCEMAMLPWVIEMISDNAPREYVRDNGIHPINAVRSHVYVHTVRALKREKKLKLARRRVNWQEAWHNSLPSLGRSEEGDDGKLDDGKLTEFLNSLTDRIEFLRKITGGHEGFTTVNRLGQEVAVPLEDVQSSLANIVGRIVDEVLIRRYDPLSQWGGRLERLNWDEKLAALEATLKIAWGATLEAAREAELEAGIELDNAGMPFNTSQLSRRIFADFIERELRPKWNSDFEDSLKCSLSATDIDSSNYGILKRIEWSFEKIRDTPFQRPLESAVWKLVFAAGGWTVKGPETGPVGGWEEEPHWTHTAFHL